MSELQNIITELDIMIKQESKEMVNYCIARDRNTWFMNPNEYFEEVWGRPEWDAENTVFDYWYLQWMKFILNYLKIKRWEKQ